MIIRTSLKRWFNLGLEPPFCCRSKSPQFLIWESIFLLINIFRVMEGMRCKLLEKRNSLEVAHAKRKKMLEAWNEDSTPKKVEPVTFQVILKGWITNHNFQTKLRCRKKGVPFRPSKINSAISNTYHRPPVLILLILKLAFRIFFLFAKNI